MNATRVQLTSILRSGLLEGDKGAPNLSEADLTTICHLARSEGLAGLFVKASRALGIELPESEDALLRNQVLRTAAANLHRRKILARVAESFAQSGLDVMVLKGMALIEQVYERCELRPMGDVDLMIRPHQTAEACRVLEEMGCYCGAPLLRDDFFPRCYYERAYYAPGSPPVKLDVHVRPFRPNWYRRSIADDALWDGCESLDIEGRLVWIPSAHRTLIHLLTHAAVHGGGRLLWLLDIACYARTMTNRIDWDQFAVLVANWRLAHPVLMTLDAVEDSFGLLAPPQVRRRLQRLRVGSVDRLVLWHAPRDAAHPVRHGLIEVLTLPGVAQRLTYLRALLFPQRGHLANLYPHRHPGWEICAQAWRLVRSVSRLFRSTFARPARGVA